MALFRFSNSSYKSTSQPWNRSAMTLASLKHLASLPILNHPTKEIFWYVFGLEDLKDDEFLICHRRIYHSSIKLPTSVWKETEDVDHRENLGVISTDTWPSFRLRRSVSKLRSVSLTFPILATWLPPTMTHTSLYASSIHLNVNMKRRKKDFVQQCSKFHLRPHSHETQGVSTFADWWETYT